MTDLATAGDSKIKIGPQSPASFYTAQKPIWDMIDALLGGTAAMRKQKQTLLPKYPSEHIDNYTHRLDRAVLLNYYKRTVLGLVGKPFSDPMVIPENMPDDVEELFDDIDRLGNDLDAFARNVFQVGLAKGMVHILVDYPQATTPVRSLAEEREIGAAPYMVMIRPEDLLAAFSEVINGVETLTHVRIKECSTTKGTGDNQWGEESVDRIRILEPGKWELWELGSKNKEYTKIDEGTTSLDYIPLMTFYAEREDLMRSRPPLLDLAYLNVAHWQSSSDQRNILTVSRFPILAASGVDPNETLEIGPNRYFTTREPTAKLYYVEHGGAATGTGRQDLEDLKTEMAMMGLQLLMPQQSGNVTATSKALDSMESNCGLQSLVLNFQNVLNEAIGIMLDWMDQGDTEVDDVKISTDFGLTSGQQQDLTILMAARANREISHTAFITELVNRGTLEADFDMEADTALLNEENGTTPESTVGTNGLPAKKPGSDVSLGSGQEDDPAAADPAFKPTVQPKVTDSVAAAGQAGVMNAAAPATGKTVGSMLTPLPGAKPPTAAEPQKQVLAGGQMSGLVDITTKVSDGKLSPEAAIEIIIISFPNVTREQAKIIIDAAAAFKPTKDPVLSIGDQGMAIRKRTIKIAPPKPDGSAEATVEGD